MKKFLKQFIHAKTTKLFLGVSAAIVLYVICSGSTGLEQVFAQAQTGTSATSGSSGPFGALGQGLGMAISGISTLLIKLLAGIIWFVLYWMGDLMDNTFILEGDIGEKLRSVWVIVRNFVNIFFALVLVVAAFMSVIGYGDEGGNYAMKKFIPKMAIALIAVNFTFLACRIVLDVNNVLTTAIFSIPQSVTNFGEIAPTGTSGVKIFKKFKCLDSNANYDQEVTRMSALDQQYPGVINSLGGVCFAQAPTADLNTTPTDAGGQEIVNLDSSQFSKKDFVWTMATQFQGLHQLNKVSQLTDRNFTNLTVNAIFSIIFAVIYGTAYVAMFIILLARMVVLWITIMLSPLVAVSIVIPDLLPEELNIQKKFLDHAFVPAKMAVPLSFGYILVSQMSLAIDTNLIADKTLDLSSGEFARDISITSLMYGAASVAVLWMGVFAASKDVVGSELVGKIGDYVKGAGATVAKWPTYLPILPVSGGGVSFQTVMTGVDTLRTTIAEDRRRRDESRVKDYLARLDIMSDEIREVMDDIERKRQTGSMDATTLAGIRRLTDTPQTFDRTVRSLATTDNFDGSSKATIAQTFGFAPTESGFREFQAMVQRTGGLTELRTRMSAASTPAPAQQTINYDDALAGLRAAPSLSFSYNAKNLSGAGRELFGRSATDAEDRDATTNFDNLDVNQFMRRFTAPEMNPGERRTILKSNMSSFKAMSDVDSFRELAKNDLSFKRALRTAFSSDAGDGPYNRDLFEIYKTLFGAGRTDDAKIKQEDGISGTGL